MQNSTPATELHGSWITTSGRRGFTGSREARFPFWSFTKTLIAVAALKLAECGAFDLDAPVENEPHEKQPYTLRQLLAHTSGLPDYGRLPAYHEAVARGETA